ncbi:MAG TPA: hypothetical protein PKN36_10230, partial [bacterium]|nr:hypothetical protein [bacterium]
MKTLIWKEWREQRLFFFLAVGIIILSRIVPELILRYPGMDILDIITIRIYMSCFILPILFSLLLGVIPFTNEFIRNTKSFLLSQPVTAASLFWVKYFSGLLFLLVLILLSYLIFGIPFGSLSPHDRWPVFYLFLPMIIIYSAAFFSSLLIRNSLPAFICTPFILIFGILLISPFIIFLFLISPYWGLFNFLVFSAITATFLILSFLTWQKAVTRDISTIRTVFTTAGTILVLSFAFHSIANLAATQKLNKTIRQAKAEGIKLTPEEVIPPPVSDKNNAALVYQQAFDIAVRLKEKYKTEWEYMPYEGKTKLEELTVTQKRDISRIMKDPEFVKLYALIEKAVNMPACRFDINYEDGPAILLPHLAQMRNLARLIAARTYILAEEKQYEKAFLSAATGLQLANSLTEEPIFISQMSRKQITTMAVYSFRSVLNLYSGGNLINNYQTVISEIDRNDNNLIKGLEGEIALSGFYRFGFGKQFNYLDYRWTQREKRQSGESIGVHIFSKLYYSYLCFPVLKEDYAFYIRELTFLINMSNEPYFLVKNEIHKWARNIISNRFITIKHMISAMTLSYSSETIKTQAIDNANLDTFKL